MSWRETGIKGYWSEGYHIGGHPRFLEARVEAIRKAVHKRFSDAVLIEAVSGVLVSTRVAAGFETHKEAFGFVGGFILAKGWGRSR